MDFVGFVGRRGGGAVTLKVNPLEGLRTGWWINRFIKNWTARPWKWMVGILLSYWDGLFSGAMLVFREGKVCVYITLTILTPLIETPDPPNDTPGSKKNRWQLDTPADINIPRILRAKFIQLNGNIWRIHWFLRGGLKYIQIFCLCSSRKLVEMIQFDLHIFFKWVGENHQAVFFWCNQNRCDEGGHFPLEFQPRLNEENDRNDPSKGFVYKHEFHGNPNWTQSYLKHPETTKWWAQ